MPGAALPQTGPPAGSTPDLLAAAMLDVAADHGYAGASVARVLERAGLSRRAFYRHYSGRGDCFLAAYRAAAAEIGGRLREAARQSTAADRPEAALTTLLCALRERPAAARMIFVDALGACAAVRAEHERQLRGIEHAIDRFLRGPGAPPLQAPAGALLGGVFGIFSSRIISGKAGEEEGDLLAGLSAWVRSYQTRDGFSVVWPAWGDPLPAASPPSRRPLRVSEVKLLPRGSSALPPALAGNARRARILAATMRQAAARGYANLTIAHIVADARLPRAAFYAHFACKQEAFLAAQTHGLRESVAVAAAEFVTGATWPERVWLGLAALLDYLATHPDLARLCLLEAPVAGAAAVARTNENRGAYAIFLGEGYHYRPAPGCPPAPLGSEATIAAVEARIRSYLLKGLGDRVREALPQCAYVALAPFIGPGAAMDWVSERVQAAC